MMRVEREMDLAMLMFGFCSRPPIRLGLRMMKVGEERMVRPGCSNSYRREEAHIHWEGWGYEGKWGCYCPCMDYEVR